MNMPCHSKQHHTFPPFCLLILWTRKQMRATKSVCWEQQEKFSGVFNRHSASPVWSCQSWLQLCVSIWTHPTEIKCPQERTLVESSLRSPFSSHFGNNGFLFYFLLSQIAELFPDRRFMFSVWLNLIWLTTTIVPWQAQLCCRWLNAWTKVLHDCLIKSTTGSFKWLPAGSMGKCSCAGCVCQTPHTAAIFDDVGGGTALVPALPIALAGRIRQIVSAAAAEEALHQVVKQVTGKEHVDPGITAAVETSKQHGDDEGHVYREKNHT